MEQILQKLDNEGLVKSREIAKLWHRFIDTRMYSWLRIVKIPTILNRGNTYLHLAAKNGPIDMFEVVLDIEDDKELENYNGLTPFLVACRYGRVKIAEILMKKCDELKIDLSKTNSNRSTAFHFVCIGGNYELAELIMKNSDGLKININEKNKFSKTAFSYACQHGHLEIVEMLMKNSESMNIRSSINGYHLACRNGQKNIVKIMIDKPELLKLDLQEYGGNTGFHIACRRGHASIVKMLIDKAEFLKLDLTTISPFLGTNEPSLMLIRQYWILAGYS